MYNKQQYNNIKDNNMNDKKRSLLMRNINFSDLDPAK